MVAFENYFPRLMLHNTQRLLAGVVLAALPATFMMGCSGGGGGGNTLPTGTPLPSSVPTITPLPPTPLPTATPVGQALTLNATFSKINGTNIPSLFRSNTGEGSFINNNLGFFFGTDFKQLGNPRNNLGFLFSSDVKAVEGGSIEFIDGREVFQRPRIMTYIDSANGKGFTSKSGTLRFLKITPTKGSTGVSLTKVKFSLTNVLMVPQNGTGEANETFTINGTGEVTVGLPTG
ncbi:hypothetical protein EON80_09465 [bacterium]|nr:MAG: hypothetical protein EON80_09465 [bacterium]